MNDISNNIIDPSYCGWDSATYLIFSDNVFGNFIYYSHLFPAISAVVLGLLVLLYNPRGYSNRSLFFISIIFAGWSFFDLVLWATERTDYTMFFWSALIYFDILIYIGAFYFLFTFVKQRMPHWSIDVLTLIVLAPLFLFAHTSLNLTAFDYTNCWREALEGPLWQYYVYTAELLIAFAILFFGTYEFMKEKDRDVRKQVFLATAGVTSFLFLFSFGNIIGSLEVDWELGQYGLFGMPVMLGFLMYIIIRYRSFNARLLAPEALIGTLVILNISLLFIQKIENVRFIALVTVFITVALGILLVRSVRREVEQREEIEKLALGLELANERLKDLDRMKSEFVSIASHQLRSPLTSIRGYTSMLVEGSYGPLTSKAKEAVTRIGESARLMSMSVEDYLNVSRIQSGNMKYELTDFNVLNMASKIVDDTRREAIKRGLLITFKNNLSISKGIVNADVGKVNQIIYNLIDNAIKYTPKGKIEVSVSEDVKKKVVMIHISDSGIGMTPGLAEELFNKFKRADNANSINVTGTGLGLYIARKMAQDMKGDIAASSPGEGLGSTFTLTLPLHL